MNYNDIKSENKSIFDDFCADITPDDKKILTKFEEEIRSFMSTAGEFTSSILGNILVNMPETDLVHLGKFFKKLGFAGVILAFKDAKEQHSRAPIFKYLVSFGAVATLTPRLPFVRAIFFAHGVSKACEALWDYFGIQEKLDQDIDKILNDVQENLLKYGIKMSNGSICSLPVFRDSYECWNYIPNYDVIDEINDDFTTASETRSPLVVDLDGDGVETVSVANGVYFDHDGNGFSEKTGWVSGDDGILVRDLNDNGQIDDGSELFGDQTVLSNGEKASNGFEALADLDSNHDGVFDGDDEAFGEVMVWQDKNQNGIVDDGELMTLNEAGITSITLDYENQSITDINGNGHN